jgi:hypothetical protein
MRRRIQVRPRLYEMMKDGKRKTIGDAAKEWLRRAGSER